MMILPHRGLGAGSARGNH